MLSDQVSPAELLRSEACLWIWTCLLKVLRVSTLRWGTAAPTRSCSSKAWWETRVSMPNQPNMVNAGEFSWGQKCSALQCYWCNNKNKGQKGSLSVHMLQNTGLPLHLTPTMRGKFQCRTDHVQTKVSVWSVMHSQAWRCWPRGRQMCKTAQNCWVRSKASPSVQLLFVCSGLHLLATECAHKVRLWAARYEWLITLGKNSRSSGVIMSHVLQVVGFLNITFLSMKLYFFSISHFCQLNLSLGLCYCC